MDSLFNRLAMVRLLGRCIPIICISKKKRQSIPICEQQSNGTKHHQDKINKLFVRRVESLRVTQQGTALKRLPLQTTNERQKQQQHHKKIKSNRRFNNDRKIIKPDDTEFDCETHISDQESKHKNRINAKKKSPSIKEKWNKKTSSNPRLPLKKLFNKTKNAKTPIPKPSCIHDASEENHDDTTSSISSSISSEWSTSTYPKSHSSEKTDDLIQHRQSMPISNSTIETHEIKRQSCVENFYLGKEHGQQISTSQRTKESLTNIQEKDKITKISQAKPAKRNEIKSSGKSKQVLQNVRKMIKDQNVHEQHFNDTRQRESVRL